MSSSDPEQPQVVMLVVDGPASMLAQVSHALQGREDVVILSAEEHTARPAVPEPENVIVLGAGVPGRHWLGSSSLLLAAAAMAGLAAAAMPSMPSEPSLAFNARGGGKRKATHPKAPKKLGFKPPRGNMHNRR